MRLIDADVLKKDLTRFYDNEVTAKQLIDEQPTIEPQPEISLDESCTDCPLYDKDRHSCPRFNKVIPETLRELQSEQPEIIHCRECQHWKQGELVDKCGLLDCYADADCYCTWAVRERRQDDGCSQVSERKESDV